MKRTTQTQTNTDSPLRWIEAVNGQMPEDMLPHRHHKMYGKEYESTEYVLVCCEHVEAPDTCIRVCLENGKWYWANGHGLAAITHWASFNRATPWNQKAHDEYVKELSRNFAEGNKKNE